MKVSEFGRILLGVFFGLSIPPLVLIIGMIANILTSNEPKNKTDRKIVARNLVRVIVGFFIVVIAIGALIFVNTMGY